MVSETLCTSIWTLKNLTKFDFCHNLYVCKKSTLFIHLVFLNVLTPSLRYSKAKSSCNTQYFLSYVHLLTGYTNTRLRTLYSLRDLTYWATNFQVRNYCSVVCIAMTFSAFNLPLPLIWKSTLKKTWLSPAIFRSYHKKA